MRTLNGLAALAAVFCFGVPALPAAETHTIDTTHSTVLFKVKHLGTSNSYGRFNDIAGTIVDDDKDSSKGSIDITVKVESIDTGNEKRDQHLKSPDFFAAKQFPTITFKSKSVKALPDGGFEASGQLTLHGVTRDLKVKVEKTGTGKAMRGDGKLTGFEAKFTIKRSDFDMKFMIGGIGDEVELTVAVECETK